MEKAFFEFRFLSFLLFELVISFVSSFKQMKVWNSFFFLAVLVLSCFNTETFVRAEETSGSYFESSSSPVPEYPVSVSFSYDSDTLHDDSFVNAMGSLTTALDCSANITLEFNASYTGTVSINFDYGGNIADLKIDLEDATKIGLCLGESRDCLFNPADYIGKNDIKIVAGSTSGDDLVGEEISFNIPDFDYDFKSGNSNTIPTVLSQPVTLTFSEKTMTLCNGTQIYSKIDLTGIDSTSSEQIGADERKTTTFTVTSGFTTFRIKKSLHCRSNRLAPQTPEHRIIIRRCRNPNNIIFQKFWRIVHRLAIIRINNKHRVLSLFQNIIAATCHNFFQKISRILSINNDTV